MKPIVLAGILFAAAPAFAQQPAPAPTNAECIGGVSRFLDHGIKVFDQDQEKGWRSVSSKPGCELAAASLISEYRTYTLRQIENLYWHEGQLYAANGDHPRAIEAMNKSLEVRRDYVDWTAPEDAADIVYSLATIAFLKGDRAGLEKQRSDLAGIPPPPDWAGAQAAFRAKNLSAPNWPLNLDVVDGLVACFGKPYKEAYGSACRPKTN